jgi:hypothetical protein
MPTVSSATSILSWTSTPIVSVTTVEVALAKGNRFVTDGVST